MPKYRKKPIEIEARRFVPGDKAGKIAEWCGGESITDALGPCVLINTLEGQMRADPGDWIIKGVKGEFYPCKHDVFEATYEEA